MREPDKHKAVVEVDAIASRILMLRGQRVMLDADLAALYGVPTRVLNQAVKRNADRFPSDFVFRLEKDEHGALRSQIVTLKTGRGAHPKYLPHAFTEHGALMAATILNSPRAVEISVYVVRAFVQLREFLAGNKELARRLDELEQRLERKLAVRDRAIAEILDALRQLMAPSPASKRAIGFVLPDEKTPRR